MELTNELKGLLIEAAAQLKGSGHRLFLARTVKVLGPGGASRAERELGWNRTTIRKGLHEIESGITVWMRLVAEAANQQRTTCPTCWRISGPSSMGKAKRTLNSKRSACIHA